MKPTVSFVLVNPDGGPFDAAWRAIEAQSLPSSQLDVHVLSPAGGMEPPVPAPGGDTVIFLGAPMIPAPDLANLAHTRIGEIDAPERSVLMGRVHAHDEVHDPISRRVIEGQWCDFERITDPENVPFYWLDPRCLVLTGELFAKIGPVLVTHAFARRTSRAALGRELAQTYGLALRVRPRLRAFETAATTIDAALERTRVESTARYAFATADPRLAGTFGIPARETLMADDPATHRRRVERLVAVARELAKLDMPCLIGSQPRDLPATEQIERLTDDVLRRAAAGVARMTWIVAARGRHTGASATPRPTNATATAGSPDAGTAPARDTRTGREAEEPSLQLSPGNTIASGPARGSSVSAKEVSIVIVATDAASALPECFAAVDAHTDCPYEIIVVDNGSRDDTAALARTHPSVAMVLPLTEPVGYGEAANLATHVARGRHIVLLEPDAVPGPGWIGALIDKVTDGVGAVGPVSNGLAGAQSLVRWLERFTVLDDVDALVRSLRTSAGERPNAAHATRWLQPLCLLIPRRVLTEIGTFHDGLHTADATSMELAHLLAHRDLTMLVATDAFVARAGGLRRPLTASVESEAARADIDTLRAIVADGADAPSSASVWGVSWAGEIGTPDGPRLSVVIPVCNQLDFTKACLDSLRAGSVHDFEIVVVDNGSTDGTPEYLNQRGDVVVVRNAKNLGFAPAVNQGLRRATGREILVLNNDVIAPRHMIERLVATLDANPVFDMIGPVTNCAAPSQQIAASYQDIEDLDAFANTRWTAHGPRLRQEPVVLGFAMLMRREVLDTVGGFDERFEVGNFEDNDFSLRATVAGYTLGVAEGVYIHHFGGKTFTGEGFDYGALMRTNHARFVDKWKRPQTQASAAPRASATPAASTSRAAEPPAPPRAPAPVPATSGAAKTEHDEPSIARIESTAPGWFPLDASGSKEQAPAAAASGSAQSGAGNGPRSHTPTNGRWTEETTDMETKPTPETAHAHADAPRDTSDPTGDADDAESPELAPGDIYLVANDRLEKGLNDEAEQLFAWTIEKMPEMVLAHMGRGLALARLGRLEEAASELERTVRLEPTLSEGYNNLGVVYYMMGRTGQAQRALTRGLELEPDNDEARANLQEIVARTETAEQSARA